MKYLIVTPSFSIIMISRISVYILVLIFSCAGLQANEFVPGSIYVRLNGQFASPTERYATQDVHGFFEPLREEFGISQIVAPFYKLKGDLKNTYRLVFSETTRVDELIDRLESLSAVVYAEKIPQSVKHDFPNDLGPNTTGNNGQYYLHRIKAPQAWDILQEGSSSVRVAIIDDAFQTNHPELAGVIDGAYNVVNVSTDIEPPNSAWDHGTFIAGLISARTNNNEGMASLGRGLGVYGIRITDDFNPDLPLGGYEGLAWAIEVGAQVVNMSWGESVPTQTGLSTVINAYQAGIVMVASAGNDNSSNTVYPAAYPHVISVASSTATDTKAAFSGFGSWVDICAPGSQIWSLAPNSGYTVKSGTSFSAPLVSATAGLMLSLNPELTVDELTDCLLASADNIDLFNPDYVGLLGSGRLNVLNALECVQAGNSDYDAWLTEVISPTVSSCNTNPAQQVRVINNGQDTLFSLQLQWQLDADFPQPFQWSDTLVPGDALIIDLPELNASIGNHLLRVNILPELNSGDIDSYAANNNLVFPFEVLNPSGRLLPYTENFESGGFSNGGWTNVNPETDFGWEIAVTSGTVPGSRSARLPYYIDFQTGFRDYLLSPTFDFSADSAVSMSFEYAYQQRTQGLSDTLIVSASTDCGQNWIPLFSNWEDGSNSFVTSELSGSFFLPVQPQQWCVASSINSCVELDLSAFSGMSGIRFRFEGANSGGNNIYIDNIRIFGTAVQDTPVAGFTAGGSLSVCRGESFTLHNTSLNRPDTSLWYLPGSVLDSVFALSPVISYPQAGSYDVTLVVWNETGADTLTIEDYITVLDPPQVSAFIEPDSVCLGNAALLSAEGAELYYWPAAPSLPAVFAQQAQVSPSSNATYQVIGYANGCTDTSSVSLSVVAPPAAPTITSQDTILISSPAAQYQWYVNGNLIEGATGQLHVPQVNGNYNVRIYNNFGCTSISAPSSVVWVGLTAPVSNPLRFYPNPSSGEAWIESPCEMELISIYTPQGQLVKTWTPDDPNRQLIQLQEAALGLYFIQVNSCNQAYFLRWIRQ